ncbi:hypothetical protein Tco_1210680 [Tanacetum coccineum]
MVVPLPFIMNLYSDGAFKENLLEYVNFACKVIDDVTFDACYDNNLSIDLFTEHNGYGIMKMIHDDLHPMKHVSHVDSDLDADKNHTLDDVAHIVEDFEHEDDGNVNIPRMTTDDPWLNKLVGNGNYIGQTKNPNGLQGNFLLEVENTDNEQVEPNFKVKNYVCYPSFNPNTPWNECKPMLGMKFESRQQLKHMLSNYVVQHGYKLWYMHNDHNKVLVLCGRDVNEGNCASYKGALVTYKWIAQQYVRGYDDVSLKVGVDLPTHESTVAAKPKPTRSKKSKPTQNPNKIRIYQKNKADLKESTFRN